MYHTTPYCTNPDANPRMKCIIPCVLEHYPRDPDPEIRETKQNTRDLGASHMMLTFSKRWSLGLGLFHSAQYCDAF